MSAKGILVYLYNYYNYRVALFITTKVLFHSTVASKLDHADLLAKKYITSMYVSEVII